MKKTAKRLTLNRETVRHLDLNTEEMRKIVGRCWSVNSDCPHICPGVPDEDSAGC